jgi:hypothetical protein
VDALLRPHGHGEAVNISMTACEGDMLVGLFEHGSLSIGLNRHCDGGPTRVAYCKGGKRNGVAMFIFEVSIRHAYCVDGHCHGPYYETYVNGDVRIGAFVQGKRQGSALYIMKNGEKEAEEWRAGELMSSTSGVSRASMVTSNDVSNVVVAASCCTC